MTLSARDVDGDDVALTLLALPNGGTLEGSPPELTFVPDDGFRGEASLTFTASDAALTSAPATVTLMVENVPPSVHASASAMPVRVGEAIHLTATVADPGNDPVTLSWNFGDGSPESSKPSVLHVFQEAGSYAVTATADDGLASSQEVINVDVETKDSQLRGCGGCSANGGSTWTFASIALGLLVRRRSALRRRA